MTPSNRKRKGKSFEEKIANDLHNYFYQVNKEYKELFDNLDDNNLKPKRDFSSGVFKDSQGDINLGLLKKIFPFSIEIKHHKNLNFSLNSILKNDLSKLLSIWNNQVIPKSKEVGLFPLLVFKANYTQIFCMCNLENVDLTNVGNYVVIKDKVILLFDDFLKNYIGDCNEDC